jgi:hypothetical protein
METRDDAAPASDPAEQLSLEDFLGLPPRLDGKPATAHIGRPPGSPNRRTKEWVKFLESRYGNPLEVLMQIAFAKVDDIRAQVGCTAMEALQDKRLAATVLACCQTSFMARANSHRCKGRVQNGRRSAGSKPALGRELINGHRSQWSADVRFQIESGLCSRTSQASPHFVTRD